jgi:nickel/cobalt transporter (NicO) family protein
MSPRPQRTVLRALLCPLLRGMLWGLLCGLLLSAAAAPASAARNPFISSPDRSEKTENAESGSSRLSAGPISRLLQRLALVQMQIRTAMSNSAEAIRARPWGAAFWQFMGLGFVYGLLHALGPGHGKALAVSYFLGRPEARGIRAGLFFGLVSMFTHVLSATLLVLGGAHLLGLLRGQSLEAASAGLETASYALVLGLGLFLLCKGLLDLKKGRLSPPPEQDTATSTRGRNMLVLAVASGLAPCPGASLVLIFSLTLGLLRAGLLAMLAISLGMALTIAAFAMAASGSRSLVLTMAGGRSTLLYGLHAGLALGSALALTLLGGVLLLGSLPGVRL